MARLFVVASLSIFVRTNKNVVWRMVFELAPLPWIETKKRNKQFSDVGVKQFINLYRRWKDRDNDPFKWGDETEYMFVKFDSDNKVVRLSLVADKLLKVLKRRENENSTSVKTLWSEEYANYMIEACPWVPFEGLWSYINLVEAHFRDRRREISELLEENEHILSLSTFPRIGASNFTWPIFKPKPHDESSAEQSEYFPDEGLCPNSFITTMARSTRERRGEKINFNLPVYKDTNTKIPVDGAPVDKPDAVHMHAKAFGLGCCSLQVTIQGRNLAEARVLHDQLSVLCPIMLALTAASPAFRGYLVDSDSSWNVMTWSTDDRTPGERGEAPLKQDEIRIPKSRFDSIDLYLSPNGEKYNDGPLFYDQKRYQILRDGGLDHLLAQYIAQMFTREFLVLNKQSNDNEDDTDHVELARKVTMPSVKLKHPLGTNVGWRVEFRSCEPQLTDFDNAAICCFITLLSRVIIAYNLNFLIPISKSDENMKTAQKRDACRTERFWFRKNVNSNEYELMTIDQIINGNGTSMPGLIKLINGYVTTLNIDDETDRTIQRYLQLIQLRASGKLLTAAAWMRKEIINHSDYRNDSVVTDRINYDLLKKVKEMQGGNPFCTDLYDVLK